MKRVGVFLGVAPRAGGMFQYAQCILAALSALPKEVFSVTAAHVDPLWIAHLEPYGFRRLSLGGGKWGLKMADAMMAARIPGSLCRAVSRTANPIVRALADADCELWLFPAQDALSYQVAFPSLVTVHDLMHRYEPQFSEVSAWGRFAIREQRFRGIVDWASGVLVDSETGKQQVIDSYQADPSRVYALPYIAPHYISNGVRVADFDSDFDSRYRLPGKFLFYPAQFWEHKNHLRLITALSMLRAEFPEIHLVLCGAKKSGFDAVRYHVESLGVSASVSFTGYVPDADMPELYRRARAMVMPTFFGPTNIPPLEAFELGCPVAVSDIYGMAEQTGGAALLFDPRSVDDIVACIRRLWCDDALCADLRRRGFQRAMQWGQTQFGQAFYAIICDVLSRLRNQTGYTESIFNDEAVAATNGLAAKDRKARSGI